MKKYLGILLLVFVIAVGFSGAVSAASFHAFPKKIQNNKQITGQHIVNSKSYIGNQWNIIKAPSKVYAPIVNSPGTVFKPIINSPNTNYAGGNLDASTNGGSGDTITNGGINF